MLKCFEKNNYATHLIESIGTEKFMQQLKGYKFVACPSCGLMHYYKSYRMYGQYCDECFIKGKYSH